MISATHDLAQHDTVLERRVNWADNGDLQTPHDHVGEQVAAAQAVRVACLVVVSVERDDASDALRDGRSDGQRQHRPDGLADQRHITQIEPLDELNDALAEIRLIVGGRGIDGGMPVPG